LFFIITLLLSGGLIVLSLAGTLTPFEGILAAPLNLVSGVFNQIALSVGGGLENMTDIQALQERNAELEEVLAQFQAELVELREIASDYQRLAELLDYTTAQNNEEFITADVINIDQSGFLRTIVINRGTRDGLDIGMPVVTPQGLVGRIEQVTANASRVLLITDQNSAVSARLQTTRAEGSVIGQASGTLLMDFIPLDETIQEGDLVITSGLGGNFPPDKVIGVVTSARQLQFELAQQATVSSLIDFGTLEQVLVIKSFEPIDLSVFESDSTP
jgi:rod shape-determining protein MreC